MRVAYLCIDPGVPVFGCKGSSVHCQEIIRVLLERGCQIELFAKRLGHPAPVAFQALGLQQLDQPLPSGHAEREQAMIRLNQQVSQQLHESGPFDLVYERFSLWNQAGMEYARATRTAGILEVNSPLIEEQKTWRTMIDEPSAKAIQARCFRDATSIIAVSEEVAERLRRNYWARDKTHVVPNGVNCERFDDLPDRGNEPGRGLTIGFVGTLKPWHGVELLIDSFVIAKSFNSNLKLKIVGEGPERSRLVERVAGCSLDVKRAITFIGAVPNEDIPATLSTFDIAVAPYPDLQDFYFSPLKVLEYMAAGLPVIASDIGQIPRLIRAGQTGVLVPAGCTASLAAALVSLSHDAELRSRLGSAAARQARMEFTWEKVVDRILATVSESASVPERVGPSFQLAMADPQTGSLHHDGVR